MKRFCWIGLFVLFPVAALAGDKEKGEEGEATTDVKTAWGTVSFGSDFMSRYVWRGTDVGRSPSIQPALSFTRGGFEVGTSAAYPLFSESFEADEHDFYVSYSVDTRYGGFSVGTTANAGATFFRIDGDWQEGNTLELMTSYTGAKAPFSITAFVNVHNDPQNSVYVEASYPVTVQDVSVTFHAGGVLGESTFYGVSQTAFTNVGITATREVAFSTTFSLPLVASYVLNPYTETTFLVFGFSL